MLRSRLPVPFIILLGLLLVVLLGNQPAIAQITGLDFSIEDITTAPHIPTVQLGDLEVAPVFLDGRDVLSIASEVNPELTDTQSRRVPPAAFRSQQITQRLDLVLRRMQAYSQRSEIQAIDDVQKQAKRLAGEIVISSRRSEEENGGGVSYQLKISFPNNTPAEPIVTLTAIDARYTRQSLDELPQVWREEIVQVLISAWLERQPTQLLATAQLAIQQILVTLGISFGIWLAQRSLNQQRNRARQAEQEQHQAQPELDLSAEGALELLRLQLGRLNRLRDRNLNRFLRQVLFWGQLLLWVLSVGLISRLFYFTRPFANWLLGVSPREWFWSLGQNGFVGIPILLLLIFLGINLGERLMSLAIERLAQQWLINQADQRSRSARFTLRVPTLVSAVQGVTQVIAYSTFTLIVLNQFRAISTPLTALLGIITFAISLGAQNFIKDVINGILILLEDQYAVGDVIAVNSDAAGFVEHVNLRITQLRNLDGELITIPNGSIGMVKNMTSEWSRAKCSIVVSHDADVDQALAVMTQVAEALYLDEEWRDRVLDQPELLGIEQVSHQGLEVCILLKTQPMQQWPVVREYRRRLKYAFGRVGIEFGVPRQEVIMKS